MQDEVGRAAPALGPPRLPARARRLRGRLRRLGKHTIAEFVEDAETLELLAELGVDYAQGHHIGRPAPLAAPVETAATPSL